MNKLIAIVQAMFQSFNVLFNKGLGETKTLWDQVAMKVPSTGEVENYGWLSDFPTLRKWIGERAVKKLSESTYSIKNELFEATVEVPKTKIEDDNYGIYAPMAQKMGESTAQWPDDLVFGLFAEGFKNPCYDEKPFFSKDHEIGTGSKKKKISNMTNKPLSAKAYEEARAQMMSLTNDEGKSLKLIPNLLVVPPALEATAKRIVESEFVEENGVMQTNPNKGTASLLVVPDLANDPKKWYLLAANGTLKPFVFQERKAPETTEITDPTSEPVFNRNVFVFGVEARGNGGYAFWQQAYGSTGE